jgi:hypothetical protein
MAKFMDSVGDKPLASETLVKEQRLGGTEKDGKHERLRQGFRVVFIEVARVGMGDIILLEGAVEAILEHHRLHNVSIGHPCHMGS